MKAGVNRETDVLEFTLMLQAFGLRFTEQTNQGNPLCFPEESLWSIQLLALGFAYGRKGVNLCIEHRRK